MIDGKNFPGRGQVAILRTRPETVLEDYDRLMRLSDYAANVPPDKTILLKENLTWQLWYPAASTTPWQLDGIIRTLLRDGYPRQQLIVAHNNPLHTDAEAGSISNRLTLVQSHYGLRDLHTSDDGIEWVEYMPKQSLAVLDQIYPDGIFIPKAYVGKNIIHLPTMKTDAFTLMAGAMRSGMGGLLDEKHHWTQDNIHDTLVDLLKIQQDIHSGIFCVMDGTFAGEGPGPRAMRPYVKNTIMASSDPVALDALAAKIMGIDPLRIRFIRHAHERGLGVGDPREIKVVGDTAIAQEDWHFEHDADTFASWGQKQVHQNLLRPLKGTVRQSAIFPWSFVASKIYYNLFWYPYVGSQRAEMMLNTAWGQKFLQYSEGLPVNLGASDKTRFALLTAAAAATIAAVGLGVYYSARRRRTSRKGRFT